MISIALVFVAMTIFWGCSESNPISNADTNMYLGNGGDKDQNDNHNDDLGDLPVVPNVDGGKYGDETLPERLSFSLASSVTYKSVSKEIGVNGDVIGTTVDGYFHQLAVLPHAVIEDTELEFTLRKGENNKGETLYNYRFGPDEVKLQNWPVLEFQDAPDMGYNPSPVYILYYKASGIWKEYGRCYGNTTGLYRFYIPHFSEYAILKQNGQVADGFEL